MNKRYAVGDTVCYSFEFLEKIVADYETSNRIGIVTSARDFAPIGQICKVLWDGEDEPAGCLANNLQRSKIDVPDWSISADQRRLDRAIAFMGILEKDNLLP